MVSALFHFLRLLLVLKMREKRVRERVLKRECSVILCSSRKKTYQILFSINCQEVYRVNNIVFLRVSAFFFPSI